MKILSHRGYWKDPAEKNRPEAFVRSFALGFGTETDVRDRDGALVIAHDMATQRDISLAELLPMVVPKHLPVALNIKADGLAEALVREVRVAGLADWFVFDMSIPDMRAYLALGAPVFTRLSEVERAPAYFAESAGVWLDSFVPEWYDAATIEGLLAQGKRVCVVSSELHKRPYEAQWEMLKTVSHHPALMLCTDLPELAEEFFG